MRFKIRNDVIYLTLIAEGMHIIQLFVDQRRASKCIRYCAVVRQFIAEKSCLRVLQVVLQ